MEVGNWRKLTFENYDELIQTLNTLKLKKNDILKIDRDEKTGKITVIYFYWWCIKIISFLKKTGKKKLIITAWSSLKVCSNN